MCQLKFEFQKIVRTNFGEEIWQGISTIQITALQMKKHKFSVLWDER